MYQPIPQPARPTQQQHSNQGRSYVISYVARKPPFSRGRRGLAACACARSVDIRQGARVHFASESLTVYATRTLCQINKGTPDTWVTPDSDSSCSESAAADAPAGGKASPPPHVASLTDGCPELPTCPKFPPFTLLVGKGHHMRSCIRTSGGSRNQKRGVPRVGRNTVRSCARGTRSIVTYYCELEKGGSVEPSEPPPWIRHCGRAHVEFHSRLRSRVRGALTYGLRKLSSNALGIIRGPI